ncbi:MAG: tetratricopeptide repeat protein [Bacteroidota bacterium]
MANSSVSSNGKLLRLAILVLGTAIFLLLLFADKTNLNNADQADVEGVVAKVDGAERSSAQKNLPPLAKDEEFDQLSDKLDQSSTSTEKAEALSALVDHLEKRNRMAYAAEYAGQLAEVVPSTANKLRAGRLFLAATRLDYVQQDSARWNVYSAKSISYLEDVTAGEPANEEALYNLGFAYVESRKPENSMKGILTIRKVLDINPENAQAHFSLGVFSIETQQFEKAVSRFEKVLDIQPQNLEAKYYLALAKVRSGSQDQVKPMLQEVVNEAKSPELKQAASELMGNL